MKDCDGGIKIHTTQDGAFEVESIAGFSLHSGVNSDEIISLLKSNSEKIYNLEDAECCWIYQYNRKTIEDFVILDKMNQYGEDFTNFLQELLQTDSNVFYINIC